MERRFTVTLEAGRRCTDISPARVALKTGRIPMRTGQREAR